jgi:nitronate monooxygenase
MDLLGMPVRLPIIGAPMAGGPSTPALAAAVSSAGGVGFLAGGYLDPEALDRQIAELRTLTSAPFGINLFMPQDADVDQAAVSRYVESLQPEARSVGVEVVPSWDDDHWSDKLDLLERTHVPLVSMTFGCPSADVIARLHQVGAKVVVTVTTPVEARIAEAAGVDAVAVQGIEAGGHQGSFRDDVAPDTGWGLLTLLAAIRDSVQVPMIAAGGLMTAHDVAAVLRAGAVAAQLGTALLRTPECGAPEFYKRALVDPAFDGTAITRAFSGRRARGLRNAFMLAHPDAPSAYPYINNATRALRRAAQARGDANATNLWAGQGYRLARQRPAAEVVSAIGSELDGLL